MPKVFITGSSGTGKSAVIHELARRGFTAYDTDDIPSATALIHTPTGKVVAWPTDGHAMDWKDTYAWNWQEPTLSELLGSNDTVFIGAIVGNWREYLKRFDHVIALTVSPKEQARRLKSCTTHEFGNSDAEIAVRVANQQKTLQKFIDAGAIVVENHNEINETVDTIIKILRPDQPAISAAN